jgi:hypothetical protein
MCAWMEFRCIIAYMIGGLHAMPKKLVFHRRTLPLGLILNHHRFLAKLFSQA